MASMFVYLTRCNLTLPGREACIRAWDANVTAGWCRMTTR